jgi:thiamine-phosphate pyrophosphorylase
LCRSHEVPLIVNDHLELAVEIDADGLHVGRDDTPIKKVRNQLGYNKIIGVSCYGNLDLALQAEKESADYVAFGAFFPSLTKPDAVAASADLLEQAQKKIAVPMVAIGGIRLTNARTVIQRGCTAIAVCNDLFHTEDIKAKAAQYAQLFAGTASRI